MTPNSIAYRERVAGDFLHYQLTTYPCADPGPYAELRSRPKPRRRLRVCG
ncbi:MAG: hypothetical protein Kow00122_02110 [Thermoleophilia bacterium]